MNVSLSSDLRDFVRKKVKSGDFPSEEAVLQDSVRRFQQDDQLGPGSDEKAMAGDGASPSWDQAPCCMSRAWLMTCSKAEMTRLRSSWTASWLP